MKFLAIDIETTGLDPQVHSITEFAAVYADLYDKSFTPIVFNRWVYPNGFVWDAYCLHLHFDWIKKVYDRVKVENISPRDEAKDGPIICMNHTALVNQFAYWIQTECGLPAPASGRWTKVTPAGKNFGGFDGQFLKTHGFPELFRHRSLDPGPLYIRPEDQFPPELKLCKERAIATGCGRIQPEVAHSALEDAFDVVDLLQHYYD
jgi:hypothetical protein